MRQRVGSREHFRRGNAITIQIVALHPFGLGGLAMHGISVLILTYPFSYLC